MPNYWVMRVDHEENTAFLWKELRDGRLRQGWGWDTEQDLRRIEQRLESGPLTEAQQKCWRGNRRLLDTQPDGIQHGDLVLTPHLPEYGRWSLSQVVGPYSFSIPPAEEDYGHILSVELLSGPSGVDQYAAGVSARLRSTM